MILNSTTNDCIKEDIFSSGDQPGWIQPSISQFNLPFSYETIIKGIYAFTKIEKNIVLGESDRSWFFSHGWQELEIEADIDIENGDFKSFTNMDDFIADLEK